MKALIHQTKVVDLHPTGFDVHPDLYWVLTPDGVSVEVGWTYKDGVFTAPVEPATTRTVATIDAELEEIDKKRIRPAGEIALAIASGNTPDACAVQKLADLEAQAAALRSERQELA